MIDIPLFIEAVATELGTLFPDMPVVTEFQPKDVQRSHFFVDFEAMDTEVSSIGIMDVTLRLCIHGILTKDTQGFAKRAQLAHLSSLLCGAFTGLCLGVGNQVVMVEATNATGQQKDFVPVILTFHFADDIPDADTVGALMEQYSFKGDLIDE